MSDEKKAVGLKGKAPEAGLRQHLETVVLVGKAALAIGAIVTTLSYMTSCLIRNDLDGVKETLGSQIREVERTLENKIEEAEKNLEDADGEIDDQVAQIGNEISYLRGVVESIRGFLGAPEAEPADQDSTGDAPVTSPPQG